MGDKTGIEWTDATWPIVQGCDYESPGCTNCYAVPLIWRLAHNPNPKVSAPLQGLVAKNAKGKLAWTGKLALRGDRLTDPMAWKEPRRIFVPSHGDIFHPDVPDDFLDAIFAVMALCPQHTFQVLTKRPARMRDYFSGDVERRSAMASVQFVKIDADNAVGALPQSEQAQYVTGWKDWPLPNVWLGVSVEDQARADERIPLLLDTPASKRFLSCEPLLGPVDLTDITWPETRPRFPDIDDISDARSALHLIEGTRIDWVILGGESGPETRGCNLSWFAQIIGQCRRAGIAVFVKQLGAHPYYDFDLPAAGTAPVPAELILKDRKGGDMAEWPAALRIREFPA